MLNCKSLQCNNNPLSLASTVLHQSLPFAFQHCSLLTASQDQSPTFRWGTEIHMQFNSDDTHLSCGCLRASLPADPSNQTQKFLSHAVTLHLPALKTHKAESKTHFTKMKESKGRWTRPSVWGRRGGWAGQSWTWRQQRRWWCGCSLSQWRIDQPAHKTSAFRSYINKLNKINFNSNFIIKKQYKILNTI